MKKITLPQGIFAIVDDGDFEWLNQWRWSLASGYARRCTRKTEGHRRWVLMHRVINKTPHGMETDHINGDRLDNQKSNLRTVDKSKNGMNRRP